LDSESRLREAIQKMLAARQAEGSSSSEELDMSGLTMDAGAGDLNMDGLTMDEAPLPGQTP
jgi:Cu(I)/Ag(I) efflux system membrane fusion protein/cobalt-zinc-cadmium efflux system membrane fusion protein